MVESFRKKAGDSAVKGKFVFLVVLGILTAFPPVSAQVVDMRAFSRRRGYKAYQARKAVPRPSAVPQRAENVKEEKKDVPSVEPVSGPVEQKSGERDDQTEEFLKYIEENPHVKPDI